MQLISLNEHSTPLTEEQIDQLNKLVQSLSPEQVTWVSGFLAGINWMNRGMPQTQTAPAALTEQPTLTILYGSQTGNSEAIAQQAHAKALERGFKATVKDMGEYKKANLKNERNLLVVVSTHGEGDPPDNAEELHEFLHGKKAPRLESLRYSVLALGDTSYENFCKIGRDFDKALESLGAQRLHARADCDVDYEEAAEIWIDGTLAAFAEHLKAPAPTTAISAPQAAAAAPQKVASLYTKKNPFSATVLDNFVLNGRGSAKETRHVELSLEGSGLVFEPGDSLGVMPSNNPELVAELIQTLALKPDETVVTYEGEMTLGNALSHAYEITTLTRPFIAKYAELSRSQALMELVAEENKKRLAEFSYGREIIDVVQQFPINGVSASQFIGVLRKLPPRLYSIASSYRANPDEVHLTIAVVRYETHGRPRKGVASTHFAERLTEGDTIPVYVDANRNFKLPADPNAPIIMIGPGTGVAPFRAFLEERETLGATGKNWLFFGDQHFTTDFLYQIEWQRWLKEGVLTRMDVAFSRDTEQKVYVQHRMLEKSKDIYSWLEEGAYFYVCGDEKRMAHDVHDTLIGIVAKEAGLSSQKAAEYVKGLQKDRRYQRDVY
ncbi:MAG: assimilatory sulfite reductase (NADPH) flavoprotein subunit [Pseudomonadota bacterium]|nr:assimilatory sulfite reductase (NADPH) flavoprotein subunit [Pseudomonadota bacterium]